jgi:outer membrane lipoprotein-sorting protein
MNSGKSVCVVVLLGVFCCAGRVAGDSADPHTIIQRMARAYDGIRDYTAIFYKRERLKGKLQDLEVIALRFQEPFKVYLAWHEPYKGRVATYVEGENNNKLLVNPGGMLQFLRLSLDPRSPLATHEGHHSIFNTGLRNTIQLLMQQYYRGRQNGDAQFYLRGQDEVDGRLAYHLEFVGPASKEAGYYAYRAEIWVDKTYYLPTRLRIYSWDNQLHEDYEYRRLQLNPGLGAEAFRLAAPQRELTQTPTAEASVLH